MRVSDRRYWTGTVRRIDEARPRPRTASPVNRALVVGSKNATWSTVWPGVGTTVTSAAPARTR